MKTKLFEIRDRATFLPVIATLLSQPDNEAEQYLLRRVGYSCRSLKLLPCVLMGRLSGSGTFANDEYEHSGDTRTLRVAHRYIQKHWEELESGDVIDVEYLLKESTEPKISERLEG
jgi:hypothetical protein